MRLHSIQIGKAQRYGDPSKTNFSEKVWESGIFKSKITESVTVTKTGIKGDEQADVTVHGGPDKAICVYSIDHFDYWKSELGLELEPGAFGENFSVTGITEQDVCIGDTFQCGHVILQTTQPRQPCWKLARRWGVKTMPALVQKNGKTGWYFRVLNEGPMIAPAKLELIDRPHPDWTIDHANHIMHTDKKNDQKSETLAHLNALSKSWKETLQKRVNQNNSSAESRRLHGK